MLVAWANTPNCMHKQIIPASNSTKNNILLMKTRGQNSRRPANCQILFCNKHSSPAVPNGPLGAFEPRYQLANTQFS